MKKTPLWDNKQESTCEFCVHAKVMPGCEQVICNKRKNLFSLTHTCRKFQFDILKKDVRRTKMPSFGTYTKEQFDL